MTWDYPLIVLSARKCASTFPKVSNYCITLAIEQLLHFHCLVIPHMSLAERRHKKHWPCVNNLCWLCSSVAGGPSGTDSGDKSHHRQQITDAEAADEAEYKPPTKWCSLSETHTISYHHSQRADVPLRHWGWTVPLLNHNSQSGKNKDDLMEYSLCIT